MHVSNRFAVCLSLALAACLTGCPGSILRSTKPTPPRVSDCIEEPQGVYPPAPKPPKAGAPIPDSYVVELTSWANKVLGVATTDRLLWRGERKCIRKLQEAGQIR